VHTFKLTGDLLERSVWRGGCDTSHQDYQPVLCRLPCGWRKKFRLNEPFFD
jgi:hypothetical protein